jgi:UDP-N-acetylmuramoylalanine--D-glutamate ligase
VRFSDLEGASVGVWGAGREIRSFAAQLGRRLPSAEIGVVAFDAPPGQEEVDALGAPEATVAIGAEATEALADCDVIVRSPGVSIHRPELRALLERGIPTATATGLWLAERGGRGVIGITGTKGKSTTAAFAHHLALAAGADAVLAGNIGLPALDLLDREPLGLVVLELSSYQIADLETGPEIAVITNLFHEHVDWHGSEEAYRAEKLRLFELPAVRAAIVNARLPELVEATAGVEEVVTYGDASGWDADAAGLRRRGDLVVPAADLPLPGEHNVLNLCAALAALETAGVEPPLPQGLARFGALPHRLQAFGERDGVLWVDDSISTTPESTLAALAAFPDRKIVLLAGGQDRGQDYGELGAVLAQRGACVVGMPSTGERAVAAARAAGVPATRAIAAGDLEDAVRRAGELAAPGSAILLSPAAPSYDRFRNFEERGKRFRALLAAS